MDAKPQRPARAIRVRADENVPVGAGKSLHQRYKSTGALPTLLSAGGLKAAAKRTAFGDVSNTANSTARTFQPSHDDSVLGLKNPLAVLEKALPLEAENKPAPLRRPAQRPLSLSGVKALLSNVSSAATGTTAPKPSQSEPQPAAHAANTRRPVGKRHTLVYHDSPASDTSKPVVQALKETQAANPTAPVHQSLAPRHHKSQPHLRPEVPVLRKTQSKLIRPSPTEMTRDHDDHDEYDDQDDHVADVRAEQRAHQILHHQFPARPDASAEAAPAKKEYGPSKSLALSQEEHNQMVMYELLAERDRHLEQEALAKAEYASHLLAVAELTEPEEYWDDEAEGDPEEDLYDEEGYTTARSYPSRGENLTVGDNVTGGDNTTGGATAVLPPKVTAKVRKELALAKEVVEACRVPEDVEEEHLDPTMVAEYGDDIFQYMKELETKMLPDAHYMDNQAEIQWSMRSVLMEWIMQVHHRFNLLPETLFLCANYIDRFLSCKVVSLGKLQLVGATAIFIAAKYEEINCPSVHEIAYMVDGGYTVDEILKAERFMLSMLSFELGWPGPMSFLRRISKADDYDVEIRTLAKYFLEVAIMDERFVGCPPSFVAAGAHCLARMMLKKGDWTPAHIHYSNYTFGQLRPLLTMLHECCDNPQQHHAVVYDKYADRRYQRASLYCEGEMAKGFTVPETSGPSLLTAMGSVVGAASYDVINPWRYDGRQ